MYVTIVHDNSSECIVDYYIKLSFFKNNLNLTNSLDNILILIKDENIDIN